MSLLSSYPCPTILPSLSLLWSVPFIVASSLDFMMAVVPELVPANSCGAVNRILLHGIHLFVIGAIFQLGALSSMSDGGLVESIQAIQSSGWCLLVRAPSHIDFFIWRCYICVDRYFKQDLFFFFFLFFLDLIFLLSLSPLSHLLLLLLFLVAVDVAFDIFGVSAHRIHRCPLIHARY